MTILDDIAAYKRDEVAVAAIVRGDPGGHRLQVRQRAHAMIKRVGDQAAAAGPHRAVLYFEIADLAPVRKALADYSGIVQERTTSYGAREIIALIEHLIADGAAYDRYNAELETVVRLVKKWILRAPPGAGPAQGLSWGRGRGRSTWGARRPPPHDGGPPRRSHGPAERDDRFGSKAD